MFGSPLSRYAGPIAPVAGILVIASRLVIIVTTPADIDALKVYVLSGTHAINSVVSITAYGCSLSPSPQSMSARRGQRTLSV